MFFFIFIFIFVGLITTPNARRQRAIRPVLLSCQNLANHSTRTDAMQCCVICSFLLQAATLSTATETGLAWPLDLLPNPVVFFRSRLASFRAFQAVSAFPFSRVFACVIWRITQRRGSFFFF